MASSHRRRRITNPMRILFLAAVFVAMFPVSLLALLLGYALDQSVNKPRP